MRTLGPVLWRSARLAAVLGCVAVTALQADTLILRNGDRLKGEVVRREQGIVIFRSATFGELRVPVSQVAEWPHSYLPLLPQDPPSAPAPAAASAPAAPVGTPAAATAPVPAATGSSGPAGTAGTAAAATAAGEGAGHEDPDSWRRWLDRWWREKRPLRDWKTSISLGYKLTEALEDREDLNLRFETSKRTETAEYRVTGRYDYGEVTEQSGLHRRATDRLQAGLRGRRDFGQRWYGQWDTRYLADSIALIDQEWEQSLGVGWRLWNSPRMRATVTPAATLQYQQLANAEGGWDYQATLFQDFRLKINDRLTFVEEADFSIVPRNDMNWQASFQARVEARLTTVVAADLRYELEMDETVTSTAERTQSRVLFTLGLRF